MLISRALHIKGFIPHPAPSVVRCGTGVHVYLVLCISVLVWGGFLEHFAFSWKKKNRFGMYQGRSCIIKLGAALTGNEVQAVVSSEHCVSL